MGILNMAQGPEGNKKGEGRFSFTFLRREISPAKDEQRSCYMYYTSKLETIYNKQKNRALNLCTVYIKYLQI